MTPLLQTVLSLLAVALAACLLVGCESTASAPAEPAADPAPVGSLPPGWQITQADPDAPGHHLVAGYGVDLEAALGSARTLAMATRETHIHDASVTSADSQLDPSTGQLVETLRAGSLSVVASGGTLRGGEPVGAPAVVGDITWVRIRVPESWLFPVRALRRVMEDRPTNAARPARDDWLQRLYVLGETLLVDGHVMLAVTALHTRAVELDDPAAHFALVRQLLAHDELRAAWYAWKLAAAVPGADASTELEDLEAELTDRLDGAWRTAVSRLESLAQQWRRDDFLLLGPERTVVRAPLSLELRSPIPCYVSLLWVDPDGLFHWRHEEEEGTVSSRTLLRAATGGTARGRATIYALGGPGPWHGLLSFIPPDGLAPESATRIDALTGLGQLLDLLARDLATDRFRITACSFLVE